MTNRIARSLRVARPRHTHAVASITLLTVAVMLAGFALSFVRVVRWMPLRLDGRLRLHPLPPSDWKTEWSTSVITAAEQQNAAFQQLQLVVLVLCLVGTVVALISFVALMLDAAWARRAELATRASLGATPIALAARLTTHASRLGLVALLLGIPLAFVATHIAERSWPQLLVTISMGEKLPHLLATGIAVVMAGLAPVTAAYLLLVHRPIAAGLHAGTRLTATRGDVLLRHVLAMMQLAGVMALLSGATTLARESRPELDATPLQHRSLLIAQLRLSGSTFDEPSNRARAFNDILEQLKTLPGVQAQTLASAGAWLGIGAVDRVVVECGKCYQAYMYTPVYAPVTRQAAIMHDFFDVLGISVEDGRAFLPARDSAGTLEVMVNRAFASAQFERGEPVGRHASPSTSPPASPRRRHNIVGIAPPVSAPILGAARREDFAMYFSLRNYPPRTADLLLRVDDTEAAAEALGTLRARLPRGATLHEAKTGDEIMRELSAPLRFLAAALLGIAVIVLLVSMHGTYALQKFQVEIDRRQLGVRLAIGCTPPRLALYVLVRTARMVRTAIILGLLGALGAARMLQVLIPGAPPFALDVLAAITLPLLVAALAGTLLPAISAAQLDPAEVLV